MAVKSGFFMSVNGDRRYDAAFFAEYFSSFIGNGIFPTPSTNLQVVEGNNMQTVVKPGKGWINGYYVHNDSDFILQHDVADGVLKRIDRVVLQWNYLTRQIVIALKKGALSSSPVAPALVRNTDYYELALADVLISNGITRITQAAITDQRLNSALCGVVTQTVKTVDTTTLFNQYQSWINQQKVNYEADLATWTTNQKNDFGSWRNTQQTAFTNWMTVEKNEFDAWFTNLQSVLDGDVVANLQNQIDQHKLETASTTTKGHVKLSNSTTSTSETEAATPKAVKVVNDTLTAHLAEKGQQNGYASLDEDGKVPNAQLPTMDYIPINQKGVANGVATLDSSGEIPLSQLRKSPVVSATGTYVGNQTTRTINVGFTPKYVKITPLGVAVNSENYCILYLTGGPGLKYLYIKGSASTLESFVDSNTGIVTGGFKLLGLSGYPQVANVSGVQYFWEAFK